MDLDTELLSAGQFLVAKTGGSIIGIGRLRSYPDCTEVATVGVVDKFRNKGAGSGLVRELIKRGPAEIFVTCVIPDFFKRFGFETVKQYPPALQKKVDFCISYNFKVSEVFVMKICK